jgi:hypothetical protein
MNAVCWSLSVHFAWPVATIPCVAPFCAVDSTPLYPKPLNPKTLNPVISVFFNFVVQFNFIEIVSSYIGHLLLLAVVGTFVAHVQVLWRMTMNLSSSARMESVAALTTMAVGYRWSPGLCADARRFIGEQQVAAVTRDA